VLTVALASLSGYNCRTMNLQLNNWPPYAKYFTGAQHAIQGTVLVQPQAWSPQLGNYRDLLIYLPPSYLVSERRYPVIYMQDGQNLFDAATSFAGVEWGVDDTLQVLSAEGIEAIVVGVPNSGERRLNEYTSPVNSWWRGSGDHYAAFLIDTVKPLIDRDFRTIAARSHTGIFGSSLGALISLYAFFTRSDVFGFVGAMSPSLWVGRGLILDQVRASPVVPGRLYLDNGTHEPSAQRLANLLRDKGYADFKYVVDEDGRHTEADWARRLPAALRYLLT
jgi:predicted alpha/beta superfamily hydrolase